MTDNKNFLKQVSRLFSQPNLITPEKHSELNFLLSDILNIILELFHNSSFQESLWLSSFLVN